MTTSGPERPESADAPESAEQTPAQVSAPPYYYPSYPQQQQQQWPGYWYPPVGPPPPRRRLSRGRIAIIVTVVVVYVAMTIGLVVVGFLGGLGVLQGNLAVGDCINDDLGSSSQFTSNKVSCNDVTAAYQVIGTMTTSVGSSDHQACVNAFPQTEAEFQNTHLSGYGNVYCLVHVNR